MLPYFSVEHFSLGPFKFYIWGFFIALAFLVGLVLAIGQGKKIGIAPKKTIFMAIFIYVGAIIGARLFFVLQSPAEFFAEPMTLLEIYQGGMMFFGGLFGGILAGWLYIRKWENRWALINRLTSVIPLTMAIGRIGCFLANDHQGALTNVPWAILWPDGSLRHPVALYLVLFNLALAGFLWWRQKKQGQVFFTFLILYGAGRFLLDFSRDFSADPHYLALSVSQWISAVLFIISGIIFLNKLTRNYKSDNSH
ncbi:MAG: hypothetical protein A2Y98_02865 [Candidatus Portnoybacteria bacterium RBG_19FT_COMBO_36_7]|uniref:Phosphatidylglycerol--prolipoprotein diacylglyceryl transferase n=1 Tax=Candidatus Portnoybacteria bacterium RBG_19FT_COMBO_36_7 TaxID=1801992 RepID=A0A1G2FAA5_9BACT|nr:MAG: hypothetical protein A2Y98_02865 [Candidatus Portnoybacteria bacterium RBG_19FT_COMBO_36_7]